MRQVQQQVQTNAAAILRKTGLCAALVLCLAGGAHAQTNTAGAIAGRAEAGTTITIRNPDTGFHRTVTVGSDGSYRFSQLPVGQYVVTQEGGAERKASVNVGTATTVDFASASDLDAVTVLGSGVINPIDVSSVESATVLTAERIAKIPVPRDTTSVALLAPGTVRGDNAFGNLASFGGASVAENQYYVNGFNITNSFRGLNFTSVPFEAVAEQQIKTGGYGAEFGRSLGGVVNQVTKRGTNQFQAGGNLFWSPDDLRAEPQSMFLTNGTLRQDNSQDTEDDIVQNVWASGALVQDRLFAYGLLSYRRNERDTWGTVVAPVNTSATATTPAWLVKLDWNITDDHILELTGFSDSQETETDVYRNTIGVLDRGAFVGTNIVEQGGDNTVLKYTGYLTETFTLSALAGYGEFSRSQRLRTAAGQDVSYGGNIGIEASGCPVISDIRPGYRRAITGTYASTCNITGAAIDRIDSGDEREQFRLDAEWLLGPHRVRFGYDLDDYTSVAGQSIEGGRQWQYSTFDPTPEAPNSGDEEDRVREQIVNQGSTNVVKQRAFYVEDSWNITDRFIAYLGARWDSFENLDGTGSTFVKIDDQFGPRLGFSWDVLGDSTFKVYGNAGRYALPLTPSVAVRGASASLFTREDFDFSGVDPVTGAPLDRVSRGNFRYVNAEAGNPNNPATIASKTLDPMYQDEYILGFQKALNDNLSLNVRGIFRDLKAAIDDTCDYTAIIEAAEAEGLVPVVPNPGFPGCRLFNPGQDGVFVTDVEGDGTLRTYVVPGARLAPDAKRTYSALEFTLDGNWDKAFVQASYTYAKSKGNTEGGVKSDIGQANTSTTQDFDYLELATDTYGYLPNDRRHTLKLFGEYEFTDHWSVGANLLVQSGRPINCLGVLDYDPLRAPGAPPRDETDGDAGYTPHPYGAAFMRCNNLPVPRGTSGRLPWTNALDMNVAWKPAFAEGLQFKVDVFNVANNRKVLSVTEIAEVAATGNASELYLVPTSFQAPRSVRFMVQYDF